MKTLPVYAVTGFLDSGKTSFLNNLLNRSDWQDVKLLLLQFESGEEDFVGTHGNCKCVSFPKKMLEQSTAQVVRQIRESIFSNAPDEIWIEWNGIVPFSQLQSLLLDQSLKKLCKLKKVVHITDASSVEQLLGRTGGALPEQISNSDIAAVRNISTAFPLKRIKKVLKGINPSIDVYSAGEYNELYRQLFKKKERPLNFFFISTILLEVLYFAAQPLVDKLNLPLNRITVVFIGIILQAVPFLLIGVLLSSAIQVFVPQSWIERRFPKSLPLGMLAAIIGGFCLPVCDCASIPIFRSLVRKGIPLPAAITFMTAAPVINPVVILSTYYAFGGDLTVVLGRVGLGILCAVAVGLLFAVEPSKKAVLAGGGLDRLMCSCGCYEDTQSTDSAKNKLGLFVRHAQAEFFSVGKYLVIGTFLASAFQIAGTGFFTDAQRGAGLALSIAIMMVMAFLLSLCSSSDAVIARSFATQFPMGAIMGFLVFGPVMDIKNVMMLSSGFKKSFVAKLLLAAFGVCFISVFVFSSLGVF